jgi:hypothetical protein
MDWKQLLAYMTGSVDQQLLLRNEYLVTENRILRQQITGRLRLSDGELMPTVKAILSCCCGCFKKAGDTMCGKSCTLHPHHCRTWDCNRMPQIVTCGRHVSVSKSSCSPQTAMMTALNRSRPLFSNATRLQVSLSSRWPMSSAFCEIGCMPKRSPIGCSSFCLTLTVIAGRDGCTCPNEVGNCPEHNAFGNFDHTGPDSIETSYPRGVCLGGRARREAPRGAAT